MRNRRGLWRRRRRARPLAPPRPPLGRALVEGPLRKALWGGPLWRAPFGGPFGEGPCGGPPSEGPLGRALLEGPFWRAPSEGPLEGPVEALAPRLTTTNKPATAERLPTHLPFAAEGRLLPTPAGRRLPESDTRLAAAEHRRRPGDRQLIGRARPPAPGDALGRSGLPYIRISLHPHYLPTRARAPPTHSMPKGVVPFPPPRGLAAPRHTAQGRKGDSGCSATQRSAHRGRLVENMFSTTLASTYISLSIERE